ncbi:superinfection immunity protein [Thioalkalivibrio sp.]|uniref:superinfection immunity protein n=1 Tax=Thioalkalivibrio sp. TaxID=2093813 RepID=UPI00356A1383
MELTLALLYLLPALIALLRDHRHFYWLFALNLLLGWTVIAWLVALVWSCLGATEAGRPHRVN